ncbi:glutaminyl-tRNA synthetase-like protein [Xylariaceae sp. FL0594]|nr:glutaminyl-tRNA synthetase-like protein [Xylariaceae sp. FL0594]
MPDATPDIAKLVLDDVTNEWVSKNELKKRTQKREKKERTEKARAAALKEAEEKAKAGGKQKTGQVQNAAPEQKAGGEEQAKQAEAKSNPNSIFEEGFLKKVFVERRSDLEKKVENNENWSKEEKAEQLERITNESRVVTRFPPEPNGYLHIGHAKAICVNFGFAKYHGGITYLRMDDTNPEAEDEKYAAAIEEMVHWLGYTPYKVTYSSDYFQQLYDFAEKLIKRGKAYVCHCSDDEIQNQRNEKKKDAKVAKPFQCAHAKRTPDENLREFQAMRDGKYKPREAFLRMNQDIFGSPNPQMWDIAAYRVLDKPHFRTGSQWRIYPTYDFAHCLCDEIESITHSLCTTEFVTSNESYEWLLDNVAVKFPRPQQREYGRLSLTGTVLSKRKILKLVNSGIVRGWDDPRLYTLIAIKRRGVPPGAILEFVSELGVTTRATVIQIVRFEQTVRRYLERTVPRLMLVLDPVPVVIEGAEEMEVDVPFSPKNPEMGSHKLKFTPTVYIDRSDFREVDSKGYFRLAPNKTVGLLQAPYPIKAVSFSKDEASGKVTEIRAVFDKEAKKPKSYIHWVPSGSRQVEARIYNPLFKSEEPDTAEGGYLNDINPESEVIYPNALIESGFDEVKSRAPWPEAAGENELGKGGLESVRFQAIRVAYFAMDSVDSTDSKIVLNRIVSLREDVSK